MSELESKGLKRYLNKSNIHKVEPPILAIDYGSKNIGLAITDKRGIIAHPLSIVRITKGNYEPFFSQLQEIIEDNKVQSLVLGVPQAFKKEHLQNIESILEFQKSIEDITKRDVFLYDESYSTSDSYTLLREQGQSQKKSKKKIDKIAATYFLQELIDFKNKQNA